MTTPELDTPDPSPTVLALAQALATRDGEGAAFTSQTKTESTARIVSRYIGEAEDIAAHLPVVTVKPGREDVARAIEAEIKKYPMPAPERIGGSIGPLGATMTNLADAVLAILPGKSEAQVRAEALRDAADALDALQTPEEGLPAAVRRDPAAWLCIRPDEEAGR